MATAAGLLGYAVLDGLGGAQKPYVVGVGLKASVTVSLCNATGTTAVKARAGYATGANTGPLAGQWLIGGTVGKAIPPGETVHATTMLGPGQGIAANADGAGINITINGIEEALA